MKPQRIQLKRTKGFRLQEVSMALNGLPAVNCARPGKYGNKFVIHKDLQRIYYWIPGTPREIAVALFEQEFAQKSMWDQAHIINDLRGNNLGCWCKLCERHQNGLPLGEDCPWCDKCHADTLLRLANG